MLYKRPMRYYSITHIGNLLLLIPTNADRETFENNMLHKKIEESAGVDEEKKYRAVRYK